MNSNDKDNQNELDPGIWGPDSFWEKVALLFTFFFTKNLCLYIYPDTYYYVFDAFKENDERGLNKTYKNCERKRPLRYFKEQEYCITMVNKFKICWILTIAGSILDWLGLRILIN